MEKITHITSAFDRREEKKKEECEFVDSLYASRGNLHIRRRVYKKTKLARQSVILKAESRHRVKGVGVSCEVVLF